MAIQYKEKIDAKTGETAKIVCYLPSGKFNRHSVTDGGHTQTKTFKPQIGGTCWYYTAKRLTNLGKYGIKDKTPNEIIISQMRKNQSATDTFYNFLLSAHKSLRKESDMLKKPIHELIQRPINEYTDLEAKKLIQDLFYSNNTDPRARKYFDKFVNSKQPYELKYLLSILYNQVPISTTTVKYIEQKQSKENAQHMIAAIELLSEQESIRQQFDSLSDRVKSISDDRVMSISDVRSLLTIKNKLIELQSKLIFIPNRKETLTKLQELFDKGNYEKVFAIGQRILEKSTIIDSELKEVSFDLSVDDNDAIKSIIQCLKNHGPISVGGHLGKPFYGGKAPTVSIPSSDDFPELNAWRAQDKDPDFSSGAGHRVLIVGVQINPADAGKSYIIYVDPNDAEQPDGKRTHYVMSFNTFKEHASKDSASVVTGIVATKHNAPVETYSIVESSSDSDSAVTPTAKVT